MQTSLRHNYHTTRALLNAAQVGSWCILWKLVKSLLADTIKVLMALPLATLPSRPAHTTFHARTWNEKQICTPVFSHIHQVGSTHPQVYVCCLLHARINGPTLTCPYVSLQLPPWPAAHDALPKDAAPLVVLLPHVCIAAPTSECAYFIIAASAMACAPAAHAFPEDAAPRVYILCQHQPPGPARQH